MRLDAGKFGFLPEDEQFVSDSETDSSSDDSDDLEKDERRRRRRQGKRKEKSRRREEKRHERTAKMTGTAGEVANLVRQLNTMRPKDPMYASLYYKAISLDDTGKVDDVIH
ncbi:uncharacterized protein SCHCODRAFT_01088133 [Schizophyllum commune H4-8]|nr:uncharacterized protein SCHCODRAFT_01088133 [Schizophyllum commune H4-8]KAI5894459.1 hypothetical protein SCHCODRAFT_01088133 [Schizophyllum commune H4-8]